MKFILILYFTLFIQIGLAYSQSITFSGKIIDEVSKEGIAGVHIYTKGNHSAGAVSNDDGSFVLKLRSAVDTLIFSHMSYNTGLHPIKEHDKYLDIVLAPRSHTLNEVVVTPLKATKIMQEVINRLEANHAVEPVYYQFYTRIVYSSTESSLHFLEEHTGTIFQKENHNSEFKLDKSRLGYFSKTGKEKYDTYRMINMTEMYTDNILKYPGNYLHKRKSKNYNFEYVADAIVRDQNCYVINYSNDKDPSNRKGTLYIDKESFGIVKQVLDRGDIKTITFRQVAGRWYLNDVAYIRKRGNVIEQKNTLYNLVEAPENKDGFIPLASLAPKFAKNYTGNFDDAYWDEINFIPLPAWVKKQISNSSPDAQQF